MKLILIPDSFKGTLSSSQICAVMDEKIEKHFPDGRTVPIPVADGGKGSVDTFITAVGGVKGYITVKNPHFENIGSYFRLIDGGQITIIEMASYAGLPLVEDREGSRLITTYEVGQLIPAMAGKGIKKIIVSLGGSSTNNGGYDATATAGIGFYDRGGRELIPAGETTTDIDRIDLSGGDSLLEQVEIITMCDINSPMYGPAGTSFISGSPKGMDEAMVLQLGEGVRSLSRAIARATGADISQVPGTGAAGAMGAGMIAFFGFRLQMRTQTILNTVKLDEIIGDADYILTGGGRLDSQSFQGKVVIGIAERANRQVEAVIAVIGGADDDEIGEAYGMGMTAVLPINRLPQDFSVSGHRSQENLAYTVDNIIRLIETGQGEH